MYDVSIIGTPAPNDIYTVEPGRLVAFPITIAPGDNKLIVTQHVAFGVQDNSIRVWVSHVAADRSFVRGINEFWHPNRAPNEVVAIHDSAVAVENGIAVAPGSYFVNFLNLVNSRNAFSFSLTNSQ